MHRSTHTGPSHGHVHHQLRANAALCADRNVRVTVETFNALGTVAFCSVEQIRHGWLWRRQPVTELVWRAEQALAPLIGLGILPMVSPRHADLHNATTEAALPGAPRGNLLERVRHWLGLGMAVRGPDATDPFGWGLALRNGHHEV